MAVHGTLQVRRALPSCVQDVESCSKQTDGCAVNMAGVLPDMIPREGACIEAMDSGSGCGSDAPSKL